MGTDKEYANIRLIMQLIIAAKYRDALRQCLCTFLHRHTIHLVLMKQYPFGIK